MMRSVLISMALLAAVPAHAQKRSALVDLINAYRAVPADCQDDPAAPLAPLVQHPALASVHIAPGHFLDEALKRAGYPVLQAEAIYVSGAPDARAVMTANRFWMRSMRHAPAVGTAAGNTTAQRQRSRGMARWAMQRLHTAWIWRSSATSAIRERMGAQWAIAPSTRDIAGAASAKISPQDRKRPRQWYWAGWTVPGTVPI
jgi:hypothetical protein